MPGKPGPMAATRSARRSAIARLPRASTPSGLPRLVSIAEARDGLREFIARGYHGDMGWLAGTAARRGDPQALWPEARTVVVLGVNYAPEHDPLALSATLAIAAPSRSMRADAIITTP